jgi:hypothetical protein
MMTNHASLGNFRPKRKANISMGTGQGHASTKATMWSQLKTISQQQETHTYIVNYILQKGKKLALRIRFCRKVKNWLYVSGKCPLIILFLGP